MERRLRADGWTAVDGVAVRGRAFDRGALLADEALAARFRGAIEGAAPGEALDALCDTADSLEGFFAAVVDAPPEFERSAYLVADGARSIPLYYATDGTVVGDRGRVVREETGSGRDPVAESELLLTRYVTGSETVWSRVRVTQPGEVVAVGERGIEGRTYREHWPGVERADSSTPAEDRVARSDREARALLRAGLETALDRTERIAEDRPIAVPLSGGHDSRLLAASLVGRGREVIGFSFGRVGHPDVEASREVAAELGIEWHHVEYSSEDWRRWYHGEACRSYREEAFADALPFLAEWPAVRRLVSEDRIPSEVLVCPGHTVATPSERLPGFVGEAGAPDGGETGCGVPQEDDRGAEQEGVDPSVEGLVDHVLESHYTLWDWDDPRFEAAARERVRRGLLGGRDPDAIDGPASAAAAYERWEWRGRMAAFTNGDCRVYEDRGLDWWLPLWDPAYVRAWERIWLEGRRGKRLHSELAVERYREVADLSRARAARTDRTLPTIDRTLSLLRHTPERAFTERDGEWLPPFLAPRSRFGESGSHPLAWYGAVDPVLLDRLPDSRGFYALRALAETGRIDFLDPSSPVPDGTVIELPTDEGSD
ncbi:asparagine synthase-related protein [Halalkalicoccus tibetensis]|uniref:Asparagine synthase-related protein n=1 Tax=Halalkalicoccus tibetensis TaxID=175632 RepID=A0ABD5V726_9EURY